MLVKTPDIQDLGRGLGAFEPLQDSFSTSGEEKRAGYVGDFYHQSLRVFQRLKDNTSSKVAAPNGS